MDKKEMTKLEEYFMRIGFKEPYDKPDLKTLIQLQEHFIRSVPFENLDIFCGEQIVLDFDAIFNKIVRCKRGGWCCENNQLFSWALKELGYNIINLGARSFNNKKNDYNPFVSHFITKVIIDGKSFLADVGYGVSGQTWQPLELILDKKQPQGPGDYQFIEEKGMWHLVKFVRKIDIPNEAFAKSPLLSTNPCRRLYCFNMEPREINSFKEICYYLQTSPDSQLNGKAICTLQTPTGVRAVIGKTYSEVTYSYQDGADLYDMSTVAEEEMEKMFKEKFGIDLKGKFVPQNTSYYTL
ncbi:arylamine N-acetyltransferase, pineal gland isozyme NAT-10-like [Polypterus senegalus]|nr:arylamine N-acetyltransferase, pineal gland isozyme NAT-10-like [Polypterus senegalus]